MAEGNIPYELREIDIINQEHRKPEFLKINPAGWIPAMITPEGQTLYETPAINLYLVERHNLIDLAPGVDDPDRGLFLSGLFSLSDDFEPAMKCYFYPHRYVLREEDQPAIKQKALETALDRLRVYEQRISKNGPYHLGERFSLVDITLSYWLTNIVPENILEPYPGLQRCLDLVRNRPKLQSKFTEIDTMRLDYRLLQEKGLGVK